MIYKEEKLLLKTIKKKQNKVPKWFMRQAGRYLPEYHQIKKKVNSFLEMCYNPELVTELTLQPIKRFSLDAAIIFSDIMVVPDALGCKVEFIKNIGPKTQPINSYKELKEPSKIEEKLLPVFKAIEKTRSLLAPTKSLIGFAGSPWTIATYIMEKQKNFATIKKICYLERDNFEKIISILTEATAIFLLKQIESGVDIVQLFDSNAGELAAEEFSKWVIEPTKKIISTIRKQYPNFPIIGFPKGAGVMYKDYVEKTEVSVICIDYNTKLEWIKANINIPIQGNLDPYLLAYSKDSFLIQSQKIIEILQDKRLIFNLGHGIIPETPIENVHKLIELIESYEY